MKAQLQDTEKLRLLFVDDEQRVLNSMRIMFRKQFDLYLASHGAEALEIIKEHDIAPFEEGVITGVAGVLLNEGKSRDFDVISSG